MHTELRVRTVCELVCHEQHYLQPEVVAFCGGFVDANSKQELSRNARLYCIRLYAVDANWRHTLICFETR